MTAAELARQAEEVGLDVVGAAPAEPYVATERHIRERRARGLYQHVDREAAARAGVGFYGKNTMLITGDLPAAEAAEAYLDCGDEVLEEAASWALARLARRAP